jgi:hypothetical protein
MSMSEPHSRSPSIRRSAGLILRLIASRVWSKPTTHHFGGDAEHFVQVFFSAIKGAGDVVADGTHEHAALPHWPNISARARAPARGVNSIAPIRPRLRQSITCGSP